MAKSCPNREKVNALLAGNMNQREEDKEIVAAMANPLGLSFNHITGMNNVREMSSTSNPHASLIHIEMKVNEQRVMAMVDTRATHTFVDMKIATKLGLKLSKSPSSSKQSMLRHKPLWVWLMVCLCRLKIGWENII